MTQILEFQQRFENINYNQLPDSELENYFCELSERLSECAYHIALRSYKRRNMTSYSAFLSKGSEYENKYLYKVEDHELWDYHNFLIFESSKIRWIMASRAKIQNHSGKVVSNT